MSRNQRIGLIVGAIIVAVVAFVIAQPGGGDDGNGSERAAQTAPARTDNGAAEGATETGTERAPPKIHRLRLQDGAVVGGVQRITAVKGDTVHIVVMSNSPDDIHLHSYDIEKKTGPGQPARFVFKADIEGIFEIESHAAEDAGREPLLARLVVEPS